MLFVVFVGCACVRARARACACVCARARARVCGVCVRALVCVYVCLAGGTIIRVGCTVFFALTICNNARVRRGLITALPFASVPFASVPIHASLGTAGLQVGLRI